MIMLRIPIAQPPSPTRKSDENGRNQWENRLPMNVQLRVGSRLKL